MWLVENTKTTKIYIVFYVDVENTCLVVWHLEVNVRHVTNQQVSDIMEVSGDLSDRIYPSNTVCALSAISNSTTTLRGTV
jgi:hypothetical protein